MAYTDITGRYAFTGLTAPAYRLTFSDSYGDPDDDSFELMGKGYGGNACPSSTPVPLGTLTADASLTRYGGFSGTLLSEYADHVYVPRHAQVEIYADDDIMGDPTAYRTVDKHGAWSAGRLPPGTYKVYFEDEWSDVIVNWWPHVATRADATEITVQPGKMVAGLDGHLFDEVECPDELDLDGSPTPGQTLTATPGQHCSGRGLTYSYTWILTRWSPFEQITVGTGTSYTVQPEDWGYDVRVRLDVSGPDGSDSVESDPMDVQMPTGGVVGPAAVTPPTITGTPQVGQTLTVSPGTWNQPGLTLSYLWLKGDGYGTGVSGPTYVVQPGDLGSAVQVLVSAHRRALYGEAHTELFVITQPAPAAPTSNTPPPRQSLGAHARVTGSGRGLRPGVRLLVRVPAPRVPGSSVPGSLIVTEKGRQVATIAAHHGNNQIDLKRVGYGRHVYVISFTGTVDGMTPTAAKIKVNVPRPDAVSRPAGRGAA